MRAAANGIFAHFYFYFFCFLICQEMHPDSVHKHRLLSVSLMLISLLLPSAAVTTTAATEAVTTVAPAATVSAAIVFTTACTTGTRENFIRDHLAIRDSSSLPASGLDFVLGETGVWIEPRSRGKRRLD